MVRVEVERKEILGGVGRMRKMKQKEISHLRDVGGKKIS